MRAYESSGDVISRLTMKNYTLLSLMLPMVEYIVLSIGDAMFLRIMLINLEAIYVKLFENVYEIFTVLCFCIYKNYVEKRIHELYRS